jgi:uncharacterized membrane protein HdeD (DUF308 family)
MAPRRPWRDHKPMTSTHTHSGTLPRARGALVHALAENWWLFLLRGLVAIVFGVMAFTWPGWTVLALTLVWAAYALADGALAIWAAISGKGSVSQRWWLGAAGLAGVIVAIFVFSRPVAATLGLLSFIGAWSIIVGVMQIVGAIRLRKEIVGEWFLVLIGAASILFGVLMFARPVAGVFAVAWMLGVFAIAMGGAYVLFALRLSKLRKAS